MKTLAIESKLAEQYKYKPLPPVLSKEYRALYRDNIPDFLCVNGAESELFTIKGSLLATGYDRIVIGDYGAFVEFSFERANSDIYSVKKGQEYRIDDLKYSKNVKYEWYTIEDGSEIKIYKQKKGVAYADYKPKQFYVSVHEVVAKCLTR